MLLGRQVRAQFKEVVALTLISLGIMKWAYQSTRKGSLRNKMVFQTRTPFLQQSTKWKKKEDCSQSQRRINGNGTRVEITMSSGRTSEKESLKLLRHASRAA